MDIALEYIRSTGQEKILSDKENTIIPDPINIAENTLSKSVWIDGEKAGSVSSPIATEKHSFLTGWPEFDLEVLKALGNIHHNRGNIVRPSLFVGFLDQ
jgi:hypothetical protein